VGKWRDKGDCSEPILGCYCQWTPNNHQVSKVIWQKDRIVNVFFCRVLWAGTFALRRYITMCLHMCSSRVPLPAKDLNPHLIHGFLGSQESAPQTGHSYPCAKDVHRQTQTTLRATSAAIRRIYALRACNSAWEYTNIHKTIDVKTTFLRFYLRHVFVMLPTFFINFFVKVACRYSEFNNKYFHNKSSNEMTLKLSFYCGSINLISHTRLLNNSKLPAKLCFMFRVRR